MPPFRASTPFQDRAAKRRRANTTDGPLDLAARVAQDSSNESYALGVFIEEERSRPFVTQLQSAGIYGSRRVQGASSASSSVKQKRLFHTPAGVQNRNPNTTPSNTVKTINSDASRFSRVTHRSKASTASAVHVLCAISENLARETCVASLDAGAPVTMQIAKIGNGMAYMETLMYLQMLQPHEVLLNEGRRKSHLVHKVMELYNVNFTPSGPGGEHLTTYERAAFQSRGNDANGRWGVDDDEEPSENATWPSGNAPANDHASTIVKFLSRACFDQTKGAALLRRIAREECYDPSVVEEYIMLSSAHALINYVERNIGAFFADDSLTLVMNSGGTNRMIIDRTSLWQLELLANSKTGKAKNSLVGTIDRTKTTVGSRLLRTNLMAPPTKVETINSRLELVETFLGSSNFFHAVHEHLSYLPDVDRMLANVVLVVPPPKLNTDDPPDRYVRIAAKGLAGLVAIKTVLSALPSLVGVLRQQLNLLDNIKNQQLQAGNDYLTTADSARHNLLIGMGAESPATMASSSQAHQLLRSIAYVLMNPELDNVLAIINDTFTPSTTYSRNTNTMLHQECFALKDRPDGFLTVLRKAYIGNVNHIYKKADDYAEQYGMKISARYTTKRGYFLTVSAAHALDIPAEFRRPTKFGRTIIFTTEEVCGLNMRARDNAKDILVVTHARVQDVFDAVRKHYDALAHLCDAIALLDMCHCFADVVSMDDRPWCRPFVSDREGLRVPDILGSDGSSSVESGTALVIRNGRYAIQVEDLDIYRGENGPPGWIANDTFATDAENFVLISGINGAGKSTLLKQIAICVVLAHCGSFVPAEQASIPIRVRLCTRIGNADDQEHNISTFMQEMKETAFVCNSATDKSLILLDELGRATSNEDGVAIAWAVSEYLLKRQAMTFFVTHYSQMTRLAHLYPNVKNVHMEASLTCGVERGIRYAYKVRPGACAVSNDYGVEMAAVCGWAPDAVDEARTFETYASSLLPGDSVFQGSSDDEDDPTTLAFKGLVELVSSLVNVAVDERCDSLVYFRSAMVDVDRVFLEYFGNAGMSEMAKILFRHEHYAVGKARETPEVPSFSVDRWCGGFAPVDKEVAERHIFGYADPAVHFESRASPSDGIECRDARGQVRDGADAITRGGA